MSNPRLAFKPSLAADAGPAAVRLAVARTAAMIAVTLALLRTHRILRSEAAALCTFINQFI
ncbi:MAG: hypothetical protein WAL22_09360 [Solirubrobacteraceae bacterium]